MHLVQPRLVRYDHSRITTDWGAKFSAALENEGLRSLTTL